MTRGEAGQDRSFRRGDTVRLSQAVDGLAAGSEGVIIGWYVDEPDRLLVLLGDGTAERIPREALERVSDSSGERPSRAPDSGGATVSPLVRGWA